MVNASQLLEVLVGGLLLGGLWGLVALGLNLIYGVMRIINMAHGEFIMLGAFGTYVLLNSFGIFPLLGILILIPIFFVIGVLAQYLVVNRILSTEFEIGSPEMMSLIGTFGLALILQNAARILWTSEIRIVETAWLSHTISVSSIHLTYARILAIAVSLLCMAALFWLITRTKFGRAMRATVQNQRTAKVVGIDTRRIYYITFGLSAVLGAITGGLVGIIFTFNPSTGLSYLIMGFIVITLGGIGSFTGSIIAAMSLGLVASFGSYVFGPNVREIVLLVILIIVLFVRPNGIIRSVEA